MVDRRAAGRLFAQAGGWQACLPQRAVLLLFLAGLVPVGLSAMGDRGPGSGVAPDSSFPEALVLSGERIGTAILLLAVLASLAGMLTARVNRAALRAGFAAVETVQPGGVYTTRRLYLVAPLVVLVVTAPQPLSSGWGTIAALGWWAAALVVSASLTAIAERLTTGRGSDGPVRRGWDVAAIVLALATLLAIIAYQLASPALGFA